MVGLACVVSEKREEGSLECCGLAAIHGCQHGQNGPSLRSDHPPGYHLSTTATAMDLSLDFSIVEDVIDKSWKFGGKVSRQRVEWFSIVSAL